MICSSIIGKISKSSNFSFATYPNTHHEIRQIHILNFSLKINQKNWMKDIKILKFRHLLAKFLQFLKFRTFSGPHKLSYVLDFFESFAQLTCFTLSFPIVENFRSRIITSFIFFQYFTKKKIRASKFLAYYLTDIILLRVINFPLYGEIYDKF